MKKKYPGVFPGVAMLLVAAAIFAVWFHVRSGLPPLSVTLKNKEIQKTILAAGTAHGLLFFIDSSCNKPFCQEYSDVQKNTLGLFKDRYKWSVLEIDAASNRKTAATFGVKMIPSVVLVKKGTDEYFMAAIGAISSLDVLEQNIYRGIQQLNSQSPLKTPLEAK